MHGETTKRYIIFVTVEELDAFKLANADLFTGDTEMRKKDTPTRRAKLSNLHLESKAIVDLLDKLSKKGLAVDHYAAQDKPLFELIEGEGERGHGNAVVFNPGNPEWRKSCR